MEIETFVDEIHTWAVFDDRDCLTLVSKCSFVNLLKMLSGYEETLNIQMITNMCDEYDPKRHGVDRDNIQSDLKFSCNFYLSENDEKNIAKSLGSLSEKYQGIYTVNYEKNNVISRIKEKIGSDGLERLIEHFRNGDV